jgi:transposase
VPKFGAEINVKSLTFIFSRGKKRPLARPLADGHPSAMLVDLPKYSPDLNPIEMPFSKLKAYLRKAAERTIPRLRRRIGRFARTLTTREASNYFRHAGYA